MEQNDLVSVSTVSVTKDLNLSRIDDDIILFDDFANLPVPGRPSRNLGLIVGMCLQGNYKYTADTEVYHVHAGEVHIIHEGQVVDNFRPSDDVRGIGIMMSYDFFHEIVKGIHELSSLFLFSRSHPVFKLQANEIEDAVDYFKLVKKKVDESGKHFRKDAYLCNGLRSQQRHIPYSDGQRQETDSCRSHFHHFHTSCGTELQNRATRRLVCPSDVYHSQVSF